MVVLCANVFYQILSNAPPCSETNGGKALSSVDCHKEPDLPTPQYGPSGPN